MRSLGKGHEESYKAHVCVSKKETLWCTKDSPSVVLAPTDDLCVTYTLYLFFYYR